MLQEGSFIGTLARRIACFYRDRGELAILPFDLLESNYPTVALTRANNEIVFPERQAMIETVKRVYGERYELSRKIRSAG